MSITKDSLHKLVDLADPSEYKILFQLLMKFVPSDIPTADEIEAIEQSKEELARGEFYRAEDIDWDNLDSMNLD